LTATTTKQIVKKAYLHQVILFHRLLFTASTS